MNNNLICKEYDKMAEAYYKIVDNKAFNSLYERPAMLKLIPELKEKKILDAGCAAGWYTNFFLENGAIVTALDFSNKMLEMAKNRVGNRARFINADLNKKLDFLKDNEFDIISASLSLHYIENFNQLFSEFYRILKPTGELIFSIHHPFMVFNYFEIEDYFKKELIEDNWRMGKNNYNVHFFRRPLSATLNPLLSAGFIIKKIDEPMPAEEFRDIAPKAYERLRKKPQFLFIKALKK